MEGIHTWFACLQSNGQCTNQSQDDHIHQKYIYDHSASICQQYYEVRWFIYFPFSSDSVEGGQRDQLSGGLLGCLHYNCCYPHSSQVQEEVRCQ